jgi:Domain of unknown function (DUF4383)
MHATAGRIAIVVGVVYVLVGVAGFLVTSGQHPAGHATHLLSFQVSPLHNVAHLVLGALLVAGAAQGPAAARQAMLAVGLVFGLLGLVGPLVMGTPADLVGLNGADHLLHGATALVLVGTALVAARRLQPVS